MPSIYNILLDYLWREMMLVRSSKELEYIGNKKMNLPSTSAMGRDEAVTKLSLRKLIIVKYRLCVN